MTIPFPKRIDRYIIGKFLQTYIFSILLIISIAVIFDYNDNIDKLTQGGASTKAIIFDYYLNFVPYYANLFSALFVFISVIFFTSKLADNSEIIAMISAGISFRRLMVPYLFTAAIIAGLNFYLGSTVIPKGSAERIEFENKYKRKKKDLTFSDNVMMQVDKGVIAYVGHFDGPTKTGYTFWLDKFEGKKLVSHLEAKRIVYDSISTKQYHWKLSNVKIRDLSGDREHITTHNQLDSAIHMEPQDFLVTKSFQETMTNKELLKDIERKKIRGTGQLKTVQVEYYKRFASAFAAFIMTVIGASLSSRKRKGGMGFSLGVGLALSVSYIFLQGISSSFAINANVPVIPAVWFPNVLFTIISIYLYKKAPR